jgi:hypothetical protein
MGFASLLHKVLPSFQVPRGLKRPDVTTPQFAKSPY